MDDVQCAQLQLAPDAVAIIHHLRKQLRDIGTTVSITKTVTLSPRGHAPTKADIALLAGACVGVANKDGAVSAGSDTFVKRHTIHVGMTTIWNRGSICSLFSRVYRRECCT